MPSPSPTPSLLPTTPTNTSVFSGDLHPRRLRSLLLSPMSPPTDETAAASAEPAAEAPPSEPAADEKAPAAGAPAKKGAKAAKEAKPKKAPAPKKPRAPPSHPPYFEVRLLEIWISAVDFCRFRENPAADLF